MKRLVLLLLCVCLYADEVPYRTNDWKTDANNDYILNNVIRKMIEREKQYIKEGDYRLNAFQRGALRAENITTQNGYNGSGNDIQGVMNNQINQLLSIGYSTGNIVNSLGTSTGALQIQINSIVTSTNSANNADNWSTYKATNSVNMNGYAIHSSSDIRANYFYGDGSNVSNVNASLFNSQNGAYYLALNANHTGTLPRVRGGLNNVTFTDGALLSYDLASDSFISTYSAVSISTSGHTHLLNSLSGILGINHGGTNTSGFVNNAIPFHDNTILSIVSSSLTWIPGTQRLQFNTNSNYSQPQGYGFSFVDTYGTAWGIYVSTTNVGSGNRHLGFLSGGTVADTSLNVGIGTLQPTQRLDIVTSAISGDPTMENGIRLNSIFSGKNADLLLNIDGSGTTFFKHYVSAGLVFTSASGKMSIATTNLANVFGVNGNMAIGTYTNNVAPANSLIVSGNIGIGNTNPTTPLYVSGNTTIDGTFAGTCVIGNNNISDDITIDSNQRVQTTLFVRASSFTSTIATGTPPLQVVSTTKVTNLNADYVDGQHFFSSYSASIHVAIGESDCQHDVPTGLTTIDNCWGSLNSLPVGTDWNLFVYKSTTTATSITIRIVKMTGTSGSANNVNINCVAYGN